MCKSIKFMYLCAPMSRTCLYIIALLFFAAEGVFAQIHSSSTYEYLITSDSQLKHIEFLTSGEIAGRGAGTPQGKEVADYIAGEFEKYGLQPFKSVSFLQKFSIRHTGKSGYNVIGWLPAKNKNAKYIIIGAHFDHIGTIKGKMFPGADDNASGVAAMLNIAQAFGERFKEKNDLEHHLVFVAFDANNHSLQGSKHFTGRMGIYSSNITCMVNLDQIGSTLAPPDKNKEYLLVLGADKLKGWQVEQLNFANKFFDINLDLDYTFYNSQDFYNIFYKLSDQQSFTEMGIPALLFTSGITNHTNKESDTPENLSPEVLNKRVELIYRFLWLIM